MKKNRSGENLCGDKMTNMRSVLPVLEHESISIAKKLKVSEDNGWVIELYVLGRNVES